MASVKERIAALQAFAAKKPVGVGIVTLWENGEWSACKGGGASTRFFKTEQDACNYLAGCDPIIIIDI